MSSRRSTSTATPPTARGRVREAAARGPRPRVPGRVRAQAPDRRARDRLGLPQPRGLRLRAREPAPPPRHRPRDDSRDQGRRRLGRPAIGQPTLVDIDSTGARSSRAAKVWLVGTWSIKGAFYADVRKDGVATGRSVDPDGYCHFATWLDEVYFGRSRRSTSPRPQARPHLEGVEAAGGGEGQPLSRLPVYNLALAEYLGASRWPRRMGRARARPRPADELSTPDLFTPARRQSVSDGSSGFPPPAAPPPPVAPAPSAGLVRLRSTDRPTPGSRGAPRGLDQSRPRHDRRSDRHGRAQGPVRRRARGGVPLPRRHAAGARVFLVRTSPGAVPAQRTAYVEHGRDCAMSRLSRRSPGSPPLRRCPASGALRHRPRARLRTVRRPGRRAGGFQAQATSANTEIGPALSRLRSRSRNSSPQHQGGARILDVHVAHAIGTGIQAVPATGSDRTDRLLGEAWEGVCARPPRSRACSPSAVSAGDRLPVDIREAARAVIRRIPLGANELRGRRVPLALQDHARATSSTPRVTAAPSRCPVSARRRLGEWKRRTGCWLYENHPGSTGFSIPAMPRTSSRATT